MDFRPDFSWSFRINRFSSNLFEKSKFEREIIRNQYHECCENFSRNEIDNLLLICNHGIIVLGKDKKLRGFCLSETINNIEQIEFKTHLIYGDNDSIKMIMDNLQCIVKHNVINVWSILINIDNEKINIMNELGFEINIKNKEQIRMVKKFEIEKSKHDKSNEKIKEFFGIK